VSGVRLPRLIDRDVATVSVRRPQRQPLRAIMSATDWAVALIFGSVTNSPAEFR
jgi:hypothetical protein